MTFLFSLVPNTLGLSCSHFLAVGRLLRRLPAAKVEPQDTRCFHWTKSTVLLETDIPGQHPENRLRALSTGYYNFNTPIAKSLPEKTVLSLPSTFRASAVGYTWIFDHQLTRSFIQTLGWGASLLSCPLNSPCLATPSHSREEWVGREKAN